MSASPDLKFGPTKPLLQSHEASCVPTSISMVLSGFGIKKSENDLIEGYFPTATLKTGNVDAGVTRAAILRGLDKIISDLSVPHLLQIDVFLPNYWTSTSSSQNKFMVRSDPSAAVRYIRGYRYETEIIAFHSTVEELAKSGVIGIYSVNKRLVTSQILGSHLKEAPERFYKELAGWIQEGHSIGGHGGMTNHARAIDGFQSTPDSVQIHDPAERSYQLTPHTIVSADPMLGIKADAFDFIIRLSERKPEPQRQFDVSRKWQDIKNRFAFR